MFESLFLDGAAGRCYGVYHRPVPPRRGTILFAPPLAEELNKSRRMVALQARRFAAAGFGVLLPDCYGCGDSEGDFRDARWDIWRQDLLAWCGWLHEREPGPMYLWGLRVGALLAAQLAGHAAPAGVVFWQPVVNGEQALTQFLRLRMAAGLGSGGQETTQALRQALAQGQSLEVAGYELHPALAAALAAARLDAPPAGVRVYWLEVSAKAELPPASRRLVEQWQAAGVDLIPRAVAGEAFWATQEIADAPALLDATSAAMAGEAR